MSIDSALASQLQESPVKRSKSHKRKHADVEAPAMVPDSQPSPTKKTKLFSSIPTKASKPTHAGSHAYTLPSSDSATGSPFVKRTLSLYLPLAPIALNNPVRGLCAEHLSPLLLTYYAPIEGIVLSYSNPRVSETPDDPSSAGSAAPASYAVSIAEYGVSYIWLTADFLVLAPQTGTPIEGWINLQSETHMGLVCWNLFSATIPKSRLPADWEWVPAGEGKGAEVAKKKKRKDKLKGNPDDDADVMDVDEEETAAVVQDETDADADGTSGDEERHGYWKDGKGQPVSGAVTFAVVEVDAQGQGGADQSGSFVSIRGTLLDQDAEKEVLRQEKDEWERKHARKRGGPKQLPYVMSGATERVNGTDAPAKDVSSASKSKEKKKSKKDKDGNDKASEKSGKKSKKSKS